MGSFITPGPSKDYIAYQSELMGLLAISVTLRVLAICFPPPPHSITGCDGQAALSILNTPRYEVMANSSNSDLCSQIADIWSSTNM
jgi:hypothetical protein